MFGVAVPHHSGADERAPLLVGGGPAAAVPAEVEAAAGPGHVEPSSPRTPALAGASNAGPGARAESPGAPGLAADSSSPGAAACGPGRAAGPDGGGGAVPEAPATPPVSIEEAPEAAAATQPRGSGTPRGEASPAGPEATNPATYAPHVASAAQAPSSSPEAEEAQEDVQPEQLLVQHPASLGCSTTPRGADSEFRQEPVQAEEEDLGAAPLSEALPFRFVNSRGGLGTLGYARSPQWARLSPSSTHPAFRGRCLGHMRTNSNGSMLSETEATASEAHASAPRQSLAFNTLGSSSVDASMAPRSPSVPFQMVEEPDLIAMAVAAATAAALSVEEAELGLQGHLVEAPQCTSPQSARPEVILMPRTKSRWDDSVPMSRVHSSPWDEFSDTHSIPPEEGTIATPRTTPKILLSQFASQPVREGHSQDEELQVPPLPLAPSRLQVWGEEVGTACRNIWDQATSATHSALASLIDLADLTGRWAEERLEEEYYRALQSASLTRELAKARILDISAPLRSNMLGSFKEMIKQNALADPDMWNCVKTCWGDALEQVLNDIEHELEVSLEAALLRQQCDNVTGGPMGGAPMGFYRLYCRCRAFLLFHYLPHDLSIFGRLKDPVYLFIMFLTLLPVHLLRVAFFSVILGMLLFPGPPDEFQLINFILLLKGSQFLSSGLFMMARGSIMYFLCFSFRKADMALCIVQDGPGSVDSLALGLVDYLGSIVLPWVAFCWLPYSHKYVTRKYVGRRPATVQEDEGSQAAASSKLPRNTWQENSSSTFTSKVLRRQGGRLGRLLVYDVQCFGLSLVVLAVLAVLTWRGGDDEDMGLLKWLLLSSQFREDLFWVKVLYGLLMLPFLPFVVPLFLKVLTHCEWTGFNEHGACVEYVLPSESRKMRRRFLSKRPARLARELTREITQRLVGRGVGQAVADRDAPGG